MPTIVSELTPYSAFCLPEAQVTGLLKTQKGLVDATDCDLIRLRVEIFEGNLDELQSIVNATIFLLGRV